MKLSKLRGAIRTSSGNPSIVVELTPGVPLTLTLQKTPLLAELGRAYEGADDTGLTFDAESGLISGPRTVELPATTGTMPDFEDEPELPLDDVVNGEDTFNESLVPDDDIFDDL